MKNAKFTLQEEGGSIMASLKSFGKAVGRAILESAENDAYRCSKSDHFNEEQKDAYRTLGENARNLRERYLEDDEY